jgi:hypothetical protein
MVVGRERGRSERAGGDRDRVFFFTEPRDWGGSTVCRCVSGGGRREGKGGRIRGRERGSGFF